MRRFLSFKTKVKLRNLIIMFIISLVLIGLIAITVITEQESAIAEQEELIAIPVKEKQ